LEREGLDPPDDFFLEMAKEVLHEGIVPDVASSGHRRRHVILSREDRIRVGSALMSLVTVEDQSILSMALTIVSPF
jgi:hypothetical protein